MITDLRFMCKPDLTLNPRSSRAVTMAPVEACYPLWDRRNGQVQDLVSKTEYCGILLKSRTLLRDSMTVSKLWAYLRQLGVLNSCDEEELRVSVLFVDSSPFSPVLFCVILMHHSRV